MSPKATKVQIALRINAALLDNLDRHAESVGRHRSEIIDRACVEYLERHAGDAGAAPKPTRAAQAKR